MYEVIHPKVGDVVTRLGFIGRVRLVSAVCVFCSGSSGVFQMPLDQFLEFATPCQVALVEWREGKIDRAAFELAERECDCSIHFAEAD